jgi:TonB family protein
MKQLLSICALNAFAALSLAFTHAQIGANATQHFEKAGLAFDYPFGWTLTDNSTPGLQSLTIASKRTGTQIVVNVDGTLRRSCDFETEIKNITNALVEKVGNQIHAPSPIRTLPVKTQVNTSEIEGVRFQGGLDRKQVTADVFAVRLNRRFVSLTFVRNNQDVRSQSAWEVVRKSMKLDPVVMVYGAVAGFDSSADKTGESDSAATGGFLNGRALVLPKPAYSRIARAAHASGTVTVQVVIDETGSVIASHAVSGHPLLVPAALVAARGAKFTPPKFCGEPLRVTGVITYNFIAQ